jgi:hypothetical protein
MTRPRTRSLCALPVGWGTPSPTNRCKTARARSAENSCAGADVGFGAGGRRPSYDSSKIRARSRNVNVVRPKLSFFTGLSVGNRRSLDAHPRPCVGASQCSMGVCEQSAFCKSGSAQIPLAFIHLTFRVFFLQMPEILEAPYCRMEPFPSVPLQNVEKPQKPPLHCRNAMLLCFCITAVLTRQTEGLLNILVPPEFLSRKTSDKRSIN